MKAQFHTLNREHARFQQIYLSFKEGDKSHSSMESEINDHESDISAFKSQWQGELKGMAQGRGSSNMPDSVKKEGIVQNVQSLLVKSYDFVIKVCRKLKDGWWLTSRGEGLVQQCNRLWDGSDQLLEEYNDAVRQTNDMIAQGKTSSSEYKTLKARAMRIAEQKLANAKEIRKLENKS